MTKKILAVLLAAVMIFAVCSCAAQNGGESAPESSAPAAETDTPPETVSEQPEESSGYSEAPSEEPSEAPEPESSEEAPAESSEETAEESSEEVSEEISEEISEEAEISEEISNGGSSAQEGSSSAPAEGSSEPVEESSEPVEESSEPVEESSEPVEESSEAPRDVKVSSIALACGAEKVCAGDSVKITASVSPANATDKTVSFSVISGGEHAEISPDGTLNAVSAGTVKIKAVSADGGASATISVKILPVPVKSVEISAAGAAIKPGETLALNVRVLPENAAEKGVVFTVSSGANCVTVDQNGTVTAVAPGKAVVKAAAKDGNGAYGTFTVTVKSIPAESVELTSSAYTVTVGGTAQLTASVSPENATDKKVTFYIAGGSEYGKVSSNGKFTALAEGKVTVGVRLDSDSKIKATAVITVKSASLWSGSGTKSDPYLIASVKDLENINTVISKKGYYFKQTADIDLSGCGVWTPIGTESKPFAHHYDGGGKTVSGLTVSGNNAGLFGCTRGAELKNVKITGFSCTGDPASNVGGLVGSARSTRIDGCSVSGTLTGGFNTGLLAGAVYGNAGEDDNVTDCRVSGTVNGGSHTGGLIGAILKDEAGDGDDYDAFSATVRGCTANVELLGCSGEDVGGLIGYAESVTADKCRAEGRITSSAGMMRGGLIGEVYYYSEIMRCSADVDITATGTAYGDAFCGGLIGYMLSRCAVHDCYATGDIECAGTWSDCQDHVTADGGIWFRYRNPCGSLIGCIFAVSQYEPVVLYNCYATGAVNNSPCPDINIQCDGALVGLLADEATRRLIKSEFRVSSRTLVDSKRVDITENELDGSIIGRLENNYSLSDRRETFRAMNYIVRNSVNALVGQYRSMPEYRVTTNITESALTDKATFEGFDFENVWKMGGSGPELR